jgi:hypothetical protein
MKNEKFFLLCPQLTSSVELLPFFDLLPSPFGEGLGLPFFIFNFSFFILHSTFFI